jgi:uncharacterized protein (UPF0332 family)
MNPRDLLDVADELASGRKEADWRSAVSRAYYAAFHVARELLEQCGFGVPRADQAHAYLWLRLANAGHPDVKEAGNALRELRRNRNWADYDLDRPLHQPTAFDGVRTAADIIDLLDAVAAEPAIRAKITDAMKVYERTALGQVTWHP